MANAAKHSYMRENDPYRGMDGFETRPNYITRRDLSEAEKSASKAPKEELRNSVNPRIKMYRNGVEVLKNSEEEQNSNFINSVRGRNIAMTTNLNFGKDRKLKTKGSLKRLTPLAIIVSFLFGGAALIFGASSSLAPTLVNLITKATDRQYTTFSMRNTRIVKYMLDGGDQIKISNFTKKYTTFSPYLKSRMSKYGIDVGYIDSYGVFHTDQIIANKSTVLRYGDKYIDANSFQDEFASNPKFREAYTKAKRGRSVGFFDHTADNYFTDRGATRDIFNSYKNTDDEKADTEQFQDIVSDRVTGADGSINSIRTETDEDTGEERKVKNGEDIEMRNVGDEAAEIKARSMVNQIASKVASDGVIACSALRIANIAAVAISAAQIYQSAAFFLSMIEPESKTMYGSGATSGINIALNYFTKPEKSTVKYLDENGQEKEETTEKSPLQSNGAKVMLGNTPVNREDVIPYTASAITTAAKRIAISVGVTNTACSGAMTASAIVSLTAGAVPGGTIATFVIGFLAQTAGGVIITGAVASVISIVMPQLVNLFAKKFFQSDRAKGQSGGEYTFMGADVSNGNLAKTGSAYMPASEEVLTAYNHSTAIALAEEAEIDRAGRSPFDTTSENTFLGSIVSKFTYLAYASNGTGKISEMAGIIGNSIRSVLPSAYAAGEENLYSSQYQECSDLPGAMCSIYDVPIFTSDLSTIDIAPDDPTYISVIERNLDSDGDVRDNTELAKFINFCVDRESPWGVTDANILNALQSDNGIIVNSIPYLNDITDIINAAQDYENQAWATGEICIASSSNPRWDSEFKYYQRYVEDMRIIDTLDGDDGKNPILAFREHHEEQNPVDHSFEGTLARISGLTRSDIAFLQEYSRYSTWLAQYNPSLRYAFGVSEEEQSTVTIETKNNIFPQFITNLSQQNPIVIDRRNYIL